MGQSIKIFSIVQAIIFIAYFIDFKIFINIEIAFLSSFFIILASAYTHKKMVSLRVKSGIFEEPRDRLDEIEDPYELYDDEINDEEKDYTTSEIKQIIKEEKKKIKPVSFKSLRYGIKGSFSLLRLSGYIFLILGFIALKNNHLLNLAIYLPSLMVGIITGHSISKRIVK